MIERIGFVANLDKAQVGRAICDALRIAEEEGIEVVLEETVARHFDLSQTAVAEEELAARVDLVASFGGDGTFLRASRVVGESGTPLLGINLGSLGFLAEVRVEELEDALRSLHRGDYVLEKRHKVRAEVRRGGSKVWEATALNDIVLNMGPVPRAMEIELLVDAVRVGQYLADGMIVASPTGSTAYNLSAGGPIVEATMDAMVLNPICPHTLGVRPLIVGPDHVVELHLVDCESGRISADGQVIAEVQTSDRILYPRSDDFCYLLRLPRRNHFQIIQEKLRWGGLPRHRGDRAGGREPDPQD